MLERKELNKKLVTAIDAVKWIRRESRKNELKGLERDMEKIRKEIEKWL